MALHLRPCLHCAGTLPALRWRRCSRRAGDPASIALASSPFTRWRHCLCRAGFIALVALARSHWRCCFQYIVIAELASLPRLRLRRGEHHAGVVTVVVLTFLLSSCGSLPRIPAQIALASFPSRWRHRPSRAGFFPLAMLGAPQCHCSAGLFASAALASLQASRWRCYHCCADVSSRWVFALALAPPLQHHSGVFALKLVASP